MAANWNPLLHEERLPNRNAGDDAWESLEETRFPPTNYAGDAEDKWFRQWQAWWFRHGLQSCRCGGLFPDIVIRRRQDTVEVSWGNVSLPGIPDDFVFLYPQGLKRLDPVLVAGPLYEMLQKTTGHLLCRQASSLRFQNVAQNVRKIPDTPREDRLAWLAGLGSSYESIKEKWNKVTAVIRKANRETADYLLEVTDNELFIQGSCHATLMFGSAAPTLSENDLETLVDKLIDLYAPDSEKSQLRDLVVSEPIDVDGPPAWEVGYGLAERVIERFPLEKQSGQAVDITEILAGLGIRQEEIRLTDRHIRGISIAGPRHLPSILENLSDVHNATLPGRRFTLAHELCHILFDRTHGKKLAMVSDTWAPLQIEQRANAFAAMLLMPPELIRRAVAGLGVSLESEQGIHEVCRRLGTSFKATLDHLKNLGHLDPMTAEQISEAREQRLSKQETI
ncbi:MAG: ImmA/IrrE family metallo-endopeptidase [Pseudomonadota bacterium]